jgi:hypothetical protein
MKQMRTMALLAVISVTSFQSVHAQGPGVVTIEGTRIRGDQEVPTVMYLVPWQPPQVDELQPPDEQLMIEHSFSPINRYEFQRLVRYHEEFDSARSIIKPVTK